MALRCVYSVVSDQATVTQLLHAVREGDDRAVDRLFPLVYEELRRRAHLQRMGHGGPATMNTTAIVHEAYIKLADQSQPIWENRAHFFAVAAKAMRHVFLDYAKRQKRQKRGGDVVHVDVNDAHVADVVSNMSDETADQLLSLETALLALSEINDRQARVVECRFFGGMTVPETAEAMEMSPATVKRDWAVAQAWLFERIQA